MIWITCNAADGGLMAVHPVPVARVYDDQGAVKLAAAAGSVHTLREKPVRRVVAIATHGAESE